MKSITFFGKYYAFAEMGLIRVYVLVKYTSLNFSLSAFNMHLVEVGENNVNSLFIIILLLSRYSCHQKSTCWWI